MNVRITCVYEVIDDQAWKDMRKLGESLTDDPQSVRVFPGRKRKLLTVECTMEREPQYKAIEKIERCRWIAGQGAFYGVEFPRTEAEAAQAERRQERIRERRRQRKLAAQAGELPARPLPPLLAPPPPPPKPAPRVSPSRRRPGIILNLDPLAPPEDGQHP